MPLYADKIFSLGLLLRDVVSFPEPDGQALQSVHESSYHSAKVSSFDGGYQLECNVGGLP